MAEGQGWTKFEVSEEEEPPSISYIRGDIILKFFLVTGSLCSYLHHPNKGEGKTYFFRKQLKSTSEAGEFLKDPLKKPSAKKRYSDMKESVAALPFVSSKPKLLLKLNETELHYMAEGQGWTKFEEKSKSKTPTVSYIRDDIILKFWLITGTICSFIHHPNKGNGKTHIFRYQLNTTSEALESLEDPLQRGGDDCYKRRCYDIKEFYETEYYKLKETAESKSKYKSLIQNRPRQIEVIKIEGSSHVSEAELRDYYKRHGYMKMGVVKATWSIGKK